MRDNLSLSVSAVRKHATICCTVVISLAIPFSQNLSVSFSLFTWQGLPASEFLPRGLLLWRWNCQEKLFWKQSSHQKLPGGLHYLASSDGAQTWPYYTLCGCWDAATHNCCTSEHWHHCHAGIHCGHSLSHTRDISGLLVVDADAAEPLRSIWALLCFDLYNDATETMAQILKSKW